MKYPTNNGQAYSVNAPQLENGYIRVANELFEAICKVKLPNEAMRIFLAIMRLTYGWNRKEAVIRNYELVELTGVRQQNIKRATSLLTESKMIKVIQPDNKSYPTYCINKNYEEWATVIQPDNMLSNQITSVIQPDNSKLSNQITGTPSEPLGDKGSGDPKDSKDIIKDNIYAAFFEKFWKKYPARNGRKIGKKGTFAAIKRHVPVSRLDDLMQALDNYIASKDVRNGFAKDPKRFISNRDGDWEEWLQKEEPQKEKGIIWV